MELIKGIDYISPKNLKAAERFVEGTPLSGAHYLAILDSVQKVKNPLLHLQYLEDFFRVNMPVIEKRLPRVYYGFRKLTKKIVKEPALIIIYENSINPRIVKSINQKMKVIYFREQTEGERENIGNYKRSLHGFEYIINSKKWKRDIMSILDHNFYADENNVSEKERTHIRELLKREIFAYYGNKINREFQTTLNFRL